jgi:hypothetical protein
MLKNTGFAPFMREMLKLLSDVYHYPVDIEFTVNFYARSALRVNLLQCRPLQTRGLGKTVAFLTSRMKKIVSLLPGETLWRQYPSAHGLCGVRPG